ncbi:DUF4198 domain-containing protein [Pontivivens ytuae]|uniref:DUF4198 domain-containing protein n=1 Tax=Pontivivens ytuae TaxID=2789856 RepID=A0A7S9LR31_9RHOB|nr:DUF4198 domain-containing protein [Pontivivens ytuae]QPH53190.1 DUF4198 domain-containing protein [Pontivivens ytuae]
MIRWVVAAWLLAVPAAGHEFWIEPTAARFEPGEAITARLRVGQELSGNNLPYLPSTFERFEVIGPNGVETVEGRLGDIPALYHEVNGAGLYIVVHEASAQTITYNDPARFARFAEYEGLDDLLEAHAARGLPPSGFQEEYVRHAKALLPVGDGIVSSDRRVGLRTEIVASGQPWTVEPTTLTLFDQGSPLADARINLFHRDPSGIVTLHPLTTNANGKADIPLNTPGLYLANAVIMESLPVAPDDGPVWRSHWASVTWLSPPK